MEDTKERAIGSTNRAEHQNFQVESSLVLTFKSTKNNLKKQEFLLHIMTMFCVYNRNYRGGVEGQKIAQHEKIKITSVTHHISGTLWHVIMTFITLV